MLKLTVRATDGGILDHAVAKIGPLPDVEAETQAYNLHISRLEPVATPRRLESINFGAKNFAGVFYGLADGYDKTLFDCLRDSDRCVQVALRHLASFLHRWSSNVPWTSLDIAAVRRRLLSDAAAKELARLFNLDWAAAFEGRTVSVKWCCVHGDLHGSNVLINI